MKKQFGRMLSLLVCLAVLFAGLPVLSASATQETLVSAYPVGLSLGDFNAKVSAWSGPSADGGASCDLTNGYLNMPASTGRQSSWSTAASVFSLTDLFAAKEQIALSVWAYAEDLNADQDITFNLKDGKGVTGSVKLPKANLVTKANTWCETVVPLTAFTGSFNWQDGLQQWSLARTGGTGTIRLDQFALVKIPYNTYPVKKVLADDSVKVSGKLENTVRSLSGAQSYYFHSESKDQKPSLYSAPALNLSDYADSLTDLAISFFAYTDSLSVDGQYALEIASGSNWSNALKVMSYAKKSSFLTQNGVWQQVVIPFTQEMATAAFDWTNVTQWRLRLQVPSADGSATTPDTLWVDQVEIISVISPDQVAAADAVIAQIAALEVDDLDDKAAVEAARTAYDALTEDQKALVDNLAALEAAEAAIDELQAAADKAAADKAAADAVIAQINALPEEIALTDKAAVEAARAAYTALTDDQKALVDNLAALEAAEAAIDELQAAADKAAADKAAADAVIAQIVALEVDDLDDKAAVEAARAAYTALTDDQKALVDNLAALEAAEAAIAELQAAADKAAADQVAADAVIAQINALPEEIALTDKAAAEAARAAYDALTDDQKALVDNLAALEAAEATIDELQAAADKAAADKAAADEVAAQINALPEEIALTDKDAIEASRTAYNALTDAQKALVENVEKLTAAEEAIKALEEAATKEEADKAAADGVITLIEALPLPEEMDWEDRADVSDARAAYDALTEEQKALVPKEIYDKLVELEGIEWIEPPYQGLKDLLDALPEEITLADKETVEAIRAIYDTLTDDQKALIDAGSLEKFFAAEEAIKALEEAAEKAEADKAAADGVTAMIEALTEESTKEAVEAARAVYEALTEAQKALVPAETLEKLVELEKKFQPTEIAYGDVDGNGKIDAADALKALQHAVKLTTLEGDVATAADVNGDDKIDATDALLMLQYTVKLIESFPVEKA